MTWSGGDRYQAFREFRDLGGGVAIPDSKDDNPVASRHVASFHGPGGDHDDGVGRSGLGPPTIAAGLSCRLSPEHTRPEQVLCNRLIAVPLRG